MTSDAAGEAGPGRRALPTALAWAVVVAWTGWWAVRQADPSGISWHFFRTGADALFHGSGLSLYADNPTLQIGPLAFVVAGAVGAIDPNHDIGLAQIVMTLLAAVVLWAVTASLPRRDRAWAVLAGGLVLAPAWTTLSVRWMHLDDALALTFIALVVWAVSPVARRGGAGHPVVAAVAMALAPAAKPWAVIAYPLLLLLPHRVRWPTILYAVAGTAAAWLPFLMADTGTLAALRPEVRVDQTSGLWWLGYHGTYLPPWDRLAQLLGAPLVALVAVWRRCWPGALLAGVAVRLVLDPQNLGYYAAGAVLAALVLDLHGRRWRIPWFALVTAIVFWQPFVSDFARRFDLATGLGLWWFRHPGTVAGIHVVWAALALVAAFWPIPSSTRAPSTSRSRARLPA